MSFRDWFSGVLGPQPQLHLHPLFGREGPATRWTNGEVAIGYMIRPGPPPPAFARDGQTILVADARLYNVGEIVAMLRGRGRDVSVNANAADLLLSLYLECGPALGCWARGMYTVAIWDAEKRRLVLTRDAIGERPLYYAATRSHLAFSSTLRALRRWPELELSVNLDGVRKYLSYGFVPGEATLLTGVRELLPGHYLTAWRDGAALRLEQRPYWQACEGEQDEDAPVESYSRPLRALLEDAVCERLPRGAPAGVLLSGGLDSSAITALAARLHTGGRLHTYSVSFGADYPNELPYSSLVAEQCGTQHHIVEVSGKQVARHLPETVAQIDDPIGDPLTVPNFLLDRAASANVEVVLNGEGGDPCLGGPKNLPMVLYEMYGEAGNQDFARERSYLRSYQKCYDDLPRLLTPAAQRELAAMPPQEAFLAPFFDHRSGMSSYLNKLMLINVRLKGAHNILCKVDRMTAAHGIEGRSPLFDRRVVEFSFAVPPGLKLAGSDEKFVLKKAVEDILPATILRRPKSGMLVPVQGWFKQDMRGLAREVLLGRRARRREILNQALIKQWLEYEESAFPRHGIKLWLVLTLELWFRSYLDAPR